jgi:hypothetical protein
MTDDEVWYERKGKTARERERMVRSAREGQGELDQSGVSTYGYVFVWKRRRERRRKRGKSGRAGVSWVLPIRATP